MRTILVDGAPTWLADVTFSSSSHGVGGYSVGWFTLALINAGIAQGKDRGGLNWFLLSLLLGPLATLILVAFYPRE